MSSTATCPFCGCKFHKGTEPMPACPDCGIVNSDGEAAESNPYAAPMTRARHDEEFGTIEGSFVRTTVMEKISETFRFFGENFGIISMIMLTISLPANLLVGLLASGFVDPTIGQPLAIFVQIISALMGPISVGAAMHLFSERMAGRRVTYGEAMRIGLQNWGTLLWTRILTGLFITLGTLALIIPGVILAFRFALVDPIVVVEGRSGLDAQKRSTKLMIGYKLQIFFGGLLIGMLIFAVFSGAGIVLSLVPASRALITTMILGCLQSLLGTLVLIFGYLIYRESAGLRSKKEPSPAQFVDI